MDSFFFPLFSPVVCHYFLAFFSFFHFSFSFFYFLKNNFLFLFSFFSVFLFFLHMFFLFPFLFVFCAETHAIGWCGNLGGWDVCKSATQRTRQAMSAHKKQHRTLFDPKRSTVNPKPQTPHSHPTARGYPPCNCSLDTEP